MSHKDLKFSKFTFKLVWGTDEEKKKDFLLIPSIPIVSHFIHKHQVKKGNFFTIGLTWGFWSVYIGYVILKPENELVDKIRRIDIAEFRSLGYLQEANRKFFHPLGMALEVSINIKGVEQISGIWDYRDDPEGMIYNLKNSNLERIERFHKNANYVKRQKSLKSKIRVKNLGYTIEPIPEIEAIALD